MPKPKLTADVIAAAIDGYSAQKTQIEAKIAELRAMLTGGSPETPAAAEEPKPPRKKRRLSAKGKRAIAEGARRRWALIRQAREEASQPAPAEKTVRKKAAVKRAPVKKAAVKKAAVKKAPLKKAAAKKAAAKKAPAKKAATRKVAPPPPPPPEPTV